MDLPKIVEDTLNESAYDERKTISIINQICRHICDPNGTGKMFMSQFTLSAQQTGEILQKILKLNKTIATSANKQDALKQWDSEIKKIINDIITNPESQKKVFNCIGFLSPGLKPKLK